MAGTAKHIVERVWPERGIRQWVLSLPWGLRRRVAYDKQLSRKVRRVWVRSLFAHLRKQAKRQGLVARARVAHPGAITFPQRFGSSLNLNVPFHTVALDGVYIREPGEDGAPKWGGLRAPSDADVADLLAAFVGKLTRKLTKDGVLDEDGLFVRAPYDTAVADAQSMLPGLPDASVRGQIGSGHRAGTKVERLGDRVRIVDEHMQGADDGTKPRVIGRRCAAFQGFSLHADVAFGGGDRKRIERLVKYTARGPIANGRVHEVGPDKLRIDLKTPWRDGTTGIALAHHELIEKLMALIPPPRVNLVHFDGVFAPRHRLRRHVVDDRPSEISQEKSRTSQPELPMGIARRREPHHPETATQVDVTTATVGRNYSWAELLRHTFEVDVLQCDRCDGRMKLIAVLSDPRTIEALTRALDEEADPLPSHPARPPPDDTWQGAEFVPTDDEQLELWSPEDDNSRGADPHTKLTRRPATRGQSRVRKPRQHPPAMVQSTCGAHLGSQSAPPAEQADSSSYGKRSSFFLRVRAPALF